MRHPTVILAVIMASIVLSCTDAEAGEDSGRADSLAESNSESVANSEPRWRRIGVEDDAVLGIDQLVKSDQGFRRWEWSLREDERLLRPNSPVYEAIVLRQQIAAVRVWNLDAGNDPSRDNMADVYTFDEARRLATRRTYSDENGYVYESFEYDGDRLVTKETRSSPTNGGWDQADIVDELSLRFEYFSHPGFPERRYRVAKSFDEVVQRVEYEIHDGSQWEYWFDDKLGDPVSMFLSVIEPGPVLLGEYRRFSSRIETRIRIGEASDGGANYVTTYSSRRAGNSQWNDLTSTRYTYRQQPFSLVSVETFDEGTGESFGAVEYTQHDAAGNWLRAVGSSGVLVVREIDYR